MKTAISRKIISLGLAVLSFICITSCSGGSEKAPDAVFSGKTSTKNFGDFSVVYPSEWNEVVDIEAESAEYSENFFEATSAFGEDNLCSSFQLTKAAETNKNQLRSLIKQDDIPQIVSQFQQTYGTDVKLESSSFYKIDGKQCLNYELSFEKNDASYIISQTYFIQNRCVYILTVTAVNGIDEENALNIPLSLSFGDD